MAADIFGQGLGAEVDAVLDRLEQQARGPGVVHQGQDAALARHRGDGGDVLHLEGQRAGRLQHDDAGLFAGQAHQLVGRHGLRVVAHADAEAPQQPVAEQLGGPIGVVAHQHLVAGLQHSQQSSGHGREAGGIQARAGGPLHLRDGVAQGVARRQADAAVGVLAGRVERLGVGQQHGGGPLHRRIDRARQRPVVAARADQAGLVLHGPVTTGVSGCAPHSVQEPS